MKSNSAVIAAIFGTITACGGNHSTSDAPSETLSEPHHIQHEVEKQALAHLHKLIDPFINGAALVYRGQFSGRGNESALGGEYFDHVISNGPAIASLTFDFEPNRQIPQVGLKVVSLVDRAHVEIFQLHEDPKTTFAGFIGYANSSAQHYDSNQKCSECLTNLFEKPKDISVDFEVRGTYFDIKKTPSKVNVKGTLTRVERPDLKFKDLRNLTTMDELRTFELKGNEWVDRIHDELHKVVPVPRGSHHKCCKEITPYSFERRVDAQSLERFFISKFKKDKTHLRCFDNIPSCVG